MTDTSISAPIAVALDGPDIHTVVQWATAVSGVVSTVKVGLETYLRDGADGVVRVRQAAPAAKLFLDLKLHDIPATVAGACRSIAALSPDIVTVHASGGAAMIEAATESLPDARIAAVTILTSLRDEDVAAVGFRAHARESVLRLASLAVRAGAQALVCSPQEVAVVRSAVGPQVLLITPGVRPVGAAVGDQQRIATPERALADGADLLVIGRPITGADNPRTAALQIAQSLISPTARL